jgi:hypothetical protein
MKRPAPLTLDGTLSWEGGPPQAVVVTVEHWPSSPQATALFGPAGGTFRAPANAYAVPPPPDYSTAAETTKRCLERGSLTATAKTWVPRYVKRHHEFLRAFLAASAWKPKWRTSELSAAVPRGDVE